MDGYRLRVPAKHGEQHDLRADSNESRNLVDDVASQVLNLEVRSGSPTARPDWQRSGYSPRRFDSPSRVPYSAAGALTP